MFEKVNPQHPDKLADRIAGALVDLAYAKQADPKIAVEVLIGHGVCHVITETSVHHTVKEVKEIVRRLTGIEAVFYNEVAQDAHLAENQKGAIRCGDNGIFKGMPVTHEQQRLSIIARDIYEQYYSDGKYIMDGPRLIICQSNAEEEQIRKLYPTAEINPLGRWTGGPDVDAGATNRTLGSDIDASCGQLKRHFMKGEV